MKIRPPKEIMKYVSFKDGVPVMKGTIPDDLLPMFDKYRHDFEAAKNKSHSHLEEIKIEIKAAQELFKENNIEEPIIQEFLFSSLKSFKFEILDIVNLATYTSEMEYSFNDLMVTIKGGTVRLEHLIDEVAEYMPPTEMSLEEFKQLIHLWLKREK